ncbi:MAG: universal stress protein [Nitrospirae bacterium]|nr:universal stress protein [Nitrospirota bacterium]
MEIVVAYDGSEQAVKALREAANMAEKMGASITVVTVVPDVCLGDVSEAECRTITRIFEKDAKGSMKRVTDELASRGITAEFIIKHGSPAEKILEAAEGIGADLVVVGSHGKHGAEKYFFGSVSSRVVEHSKCHVLVIK